MWCSGKKIETMGGGRRSMASKRPHKWLWHCITAATKWRQETTLYEDEAIHQIPVGQGAGNLVLLGHHQQHRGKLGRGCRVRHIFVAHFISMSQVLSGTPGCVAPAPPEHTRWGSRPCSSSPTPTARRAPPLQEAVKDLGVLVRDLVRAIHAEVGDWGSTNMKGRDARERRWVGAR